MMKGTFFWRRRRAFFAARKEIQFFGLDFFSCATYHSTLATKKDPTAENVEHMLEKIRYRTTEEHLQIDRYVSMSLLFVQQASRRIVDSPISFLQILIPGECFYFLNIVPVYRPIREAPTARVMSSHAFP